MVSCRKKSVGKHNKRALHKELWAVYVMLLPWRLFSQIHATAVPPCRHVPRSGAWAYQPILGAAYTLACFPTRPTGCLYLQQGPHAWNTTDALKDTTKNQTKRHIPWKRRQQKHKTSNREQPLFTHRLAVNTEELQDTTIAIIVCVNRHKQNLTSKKEERRANN